MNRSTALASALALALICGSSAQAQQMDLTKIIQAPSMLKVGEGAKVGYRTEVRMKAGPSTMSYFVAIVGETDEVWEIESNQFTLGYSSMPGGKDLALALVVDKKSGEVLLAKVGKAGEPLREVKVMPQPKQAPKAKEPVGEEVDYTLPSGKKVKATKTETKAGGKTYTVWAGRKGTEFEGVMFKSSGPNFDKALSEDPSELEYELEDVGPDGKPVTIAGRQQVFSDESVVVMSKDPVVKSLAYGLLVSRTKTVTMEVVSVRRDAKKTLSWK
jgi:hypothetical protein